MQCSGTLLVDKDRGLEQHLKLSSVEVFGNGTLMVAWGAVDAFWASAGTTFHVAGVPEIFIFQALYHIDPTSKINYLFLGHF